MIKITRKMIQGNARMIAIGETTDKIINFYGWLKLSS